MRTLFLLGLLLTVFTNCSVEPQENKTKEAWDRVNDPQLMEMEQDEQMQQYEAVFDLLPLEGRIDGDVWPGSYWPSYLGGISQRWQAIVGAEERFAYDLEQFDGNVDEEFIHKLSPAEKFDLYIGYEKPFPVVELWPGYEQVLTYHQMKQWDEWNPEWRQQARWVGLAEYERIRTGVMKTVPEAEEYDEDFEIQRWEGLCHAWAPAAYLVAAPQDVEVESVDGIAIRFYGSDLRALMTFFYHFNDSPQVFLGRRCNTNFKELEKKLDEGKITEEEFNRQLEDKSCRDTNAGSFHLVLANYLGLRGEGFVLDITRDFEVWNHPIKNYVSHIRKRWQPKDEAEIKELNADPRTKEFIEISTALVIVNERPASVFDADFYHTDKLLHYQYRLELDAEGKVIGGEWLQRDRPDFLWNRRPAIFEGPMEDLEDIYLQSLLRREPV